MYVCVYVYMCVCIHMFMYIYIYIWLVAKFSALTQTGPGALTAAYIVGTWFFWE